MRHTPQADSVSRALKPGHGRPMIGIRGTREGYGSGWIPHPTARPFEPKTLVEYGTNST